MFMINNNDSEYAKYLNQKVALRMQEVAENKTEIAECLFRYNAKMLSGSGCALCPGDYAIYSPDTGTMLSSRGAVMQISPEQLIDFVEAGAFEHVFDVHDLNSQDFSKNMESIVHAMHKQAAYADAPLYAAVSGKQPMACYGEDPKRPEMVVSVGGDGSFEPRPASTKDMEDLDNARQCSYEEFNPGGRQLQEQAEKDINSERQSKSGSYDRLKEAYEQSGSNSRPSAERVRDDKNMTAEQKLGAIKDAVEAKDAEDKARANEIEQNTSPLMSSKAMRRIE